MLSRYEKYFLISELPEKERIDLYLGETYSDVKLDEVLKPKKLHQKPVISYGVIEFVIVEDVGGSRRVCYHLFRRRNTVEYEIIMRGFGNQNQLYRMLTLLSDDERERILNNSWEDLWNDLWIDPDAARVAQMKSQSQRKFKDIKELLVRMDKKMDHRIPQRPFIFPKGRAEDKESGCEAAIREAKEETSGRYMDGELYFNSPLVQAYIGSDGNAYSDYYYVWQSASLTSSPVIELDTGKYKRLRPTSISSELETDLWLEIPIFHTNAQRLEWMNSVDPYAEFGIFKRHFEAMMIIHAHLE